MGVSALDNLLGHVKTHSHGMRTLTMFDSRGLVAGSWVNSMLLAIQFLHVYKYYRNYPRDPILLRIAVGLTLLLNIDCIIGNYANVYLVCFCRSLQYHSMSNSFAVLRNALG